MIESKSDTFKRLQNIYQAIPIPTYTWLAIGEDFGLLDHNKAATHFLDESRNDFLYIKAKTLFKENLTIVTDFRKCLESNSSFEREIFWKIRHSGAIKKLNFKYTYIQSDTLLLQIEDFTHRKEMGVNFSDPSKQQATFIENSPAAIAMFDCQMRYISVSNKWVEDYKLTGRPILGRSHYEVFPEIEQEWKAIHQHCLRGFTEKKEEEAFNRIDGSVDWIKWEIRPWYDTYKKVGGIIMFTENITRRKIIEEKLRDSENRFHLLADSALVGTFILEDGKYAYVNREMSRIFGRSLNEMVGMAPNQLLPNNFPEPSGINDSKSVCDEEISFHYEAKGRHSNGKELDLEVFTSRTVINGNKAIIGTVIDITERKASEKKIKENANKLTKILQNLPIGLSVSNSDRKCIFFNKAFTDIVGYSLEDFSDLEKWTTIAYPEQDYREKITKEWEGKIEEALATDGRSEPVVAKIRCKDGSDKTIEAYFSSIGNESIIIIQDITERIKAQEKLALSALIVNSSDDAIIGMTMDKMINSWNPGAEKIFGYSSKEVIGKPIQLIIPPNLYDEDRIISENIGLGKPVSHFETCRIGKDGKKIDVSITISPITDESGQIIGFSKIIRDISLRKNLVEQRNKMIADLVQRNRDLEQFSYIISHNLRTPVANILGICSLMQNKQLLPGEKEELLLGLNTSVNGLDTIIKDLNQILQAKNEINEAKFLIKLSDIIAIIQSNISHLILKEKVSFSIDFSEKDEIFTIKSYFYSIFYNLIKNSVKYKHTDRSPVIEIKSRLKDSGFEIVYRDNGLGIDLEKQGDQVFGLYKRFHFHTEGKGMGLFMVKTQVETLGGRISIKSEVGKGTEFIIEFI